MATYGFPFSSLSGDRKYSIALWQKFLNKLVSTGVYMHDLATSFQVVAKTGMTVTLKIGYANINGVFVYIDADLDLTLDNASGTARDDLIVIKTDQTLRDPVIEIKKNATKTNGLYTLQRDGEVYEIAVAAIHLLSNSAEVTLAMIEDLRLNNNYCGIVAGMVQQINTSTLYAQIQADLAEFKDVEEDAFTTWFASIQDIFDANAETNLLNLINARLELAGTSEMTGDLKHGNHKSTYKNASGVVICTVEPQVDGVKIIVYDAAGANPQALYIKHSADMTLNGSKVWTAANLIVSEGDPVVGNIPEGGVYLQIIP